MKLIDFIVCDDVRIEMGNKLSIMGVYNDTLTLASPSGSDLPWPLALRLGIYSRFILSGNDQAPDHFRLTIRHETNEIAGGEGILMIQDPTKPFALALPLPQLAIPGPGYLHFQIALSKGATVLFDQEIDRPFGINRP